ncbi:MAG TPA: sensory rhodopsin transducer [Bryobacteraceae bacterium]|nr:sensory rhodopsin transducer [Bryobacteraceae bacterium]
MPAIGRKQWAIAEGYIPPYGQGPSPQMISHEALCILNAGDAPAHVEITVYYENRAPIGPYRFTVEARRSRHLRFNDFEMPERIKLDTPFSSVITSDVPIVVQHTRLDSRQSANALLSTIAFPGAD